MFDQVGMGLEDNRLYKNVYAKKNAETKQKEERKN